MTASTLLGSLASFVPALILRRLAADPAVLAAPVAEQFSAAVLSADLTGFTPLAERLAHNGPDGAEELTRLLNTYFGQLIELITSHGGDVAEFAGDALLAVWPADPEDEKTSPFSPLSAAVCRAARCGLAVQSLLHNYQVAEGVRLSMRIGIGAGTVWAMHTGGVYGRWKLLLNGAPLAQVSMAERQAEPGQVILSPEAWQTLAEKECGIEHVSSLATGCVRLDAMNESPPLRAACLPVLAHDAEAGLRAYLPNTIISRLALGQDTSRAQPQSEWLAELRRVTVLFINLTDSSFNFTHGDTLPLERVHLIMRVLQATLYRYEGTFNKISVNDKGATVVAALGLPPLAHEDDVVRGVQVALAAQAELRRLGVCSAIGVTTGRAFCGSVGNDTRREYTIIGDVVNLASRLMNAARAATYGDGRISGAADNLLILTDAATYQAAQRRIAFDSLSAIKVKGKTELVAIYRPLSERSAPISQTHKLKLTTPIIGRQAEQVLLAERVQGLLHGKSGGVVVIEGEAGIGKTRLLDELRRLAGVLHLKVFSLSGDAIEKSTPYQAWRPAFSQMLDLDVLSDPDARRRHILGILEFGLDEDLQRLAPLLNVVLPLNLPDSELTAPMTGQIRADRTRSLLLQLLQASMSGAPKVVIVEDAHWLDSASWALTLAVSQVAQSGPLLFVIALRPFTEAPPLEYSQLLRVSDVQLLRLGILSSDDILTLVHQRLGVSSLPRAVSVLILERAEGNPLFCEELAYALRDTGLITIGDGECRLAPHADDLHALRLPDTVQGVVTSRIDRLPPQQQLILKVASVIGRQFTFRVLERIYPMESDRSQLPEYLAVLERLDLIRLETPELEPAYIFKHAITQEVAYNLMLFAQRRELHRQAGLAMEMLFPDNLSEYNGLLATHYFRGEVWDKAVDCLTKAGDAAVRLNAHTEARKYYAEALESLSHLPYTYANRRLYIDLILKQVSISWGTEAPEQNLRRLAEAESLAKALPDPDDGMLGAGDPVRLARVHLWMGRSHYYRNAPDEAINCFWQVLADTHSIGNEPLPAILSSAMAQALLVQGQFGQARSILTQSAPSLEQAGNSPEWVQAVGGLGVSLAASGRCEEALAEGLRALACAKEMNDLASVAVSNINLCIIHLLSGDVSSCFEAGCVAVKAAEQSGNQLYVYLSYGFLGWAEGRLGQYAAAQERFRLARAASQPLGHQLVFSDWFAAARAEIALKAGHAEEALQLAKQAVATAQAAERFFSRGLAHRVWGQALAVLAPVKQADAVSQHLVESKRCFDAGEAWLESARVFELTECNRLPLPQLTMASEKLAQ